MTPFRPPPLKEQLAALALALFCALAFLGSGVRTDRAVVPFPPEVMQPARQEALAAGMDPAAIFQGNFSMGDKFNQSLTWDRVTRDRLRAGELPLWTRDIAGGAPFVPQMGQVYHPFNLLLLVVPSAGVYGVWYLLHMVLFGYFAWRFMRRIGIAHGPALFGMVALILGLWCQARVHHNVMLSAVLPLFPMLSCTHHLLRHGGGGGHVALLALSTGLSWICGFAPASLMCTYLVCAWALALVPGCPPGRRPGALFRFAVAIASGLLLAAVNVGPILFAAGETSRALATLALLDARSLELPHLANAVWPTLFAWPADHFYLPEGRTHNAWPALALLHGELRGAGFSYPETAFYLGVAPLCLAAAGLRGRQGWFFAAAAAFGVAMAMGSLLPLSRFLPGAHSGDVKRFLLLFGVCMPVLAAQGLDRILRGTSPRVALILLGVVAVHSVELFALHWFPEDCTLRDWYGHLIERMTGQPPGTFPKWLAGYAGETAVQRAHLLEASGIAAVVALIGLAACWRRRAWTVPVLVVTTACELVWLGHGTIVPVETARLAPPAILRPVLESNAARKNGVRARLARLMPAGGLDVLATPVMPNMGAFFGVEDLGAYNPLPKRRMEEFFRALEPDREGKPGVALGGVGVHALRDTASLAHPLADLIGIEWVLSTAAEEVAGIEDRTPAGLQPGCRLLRRATCMPRATFVHAVEMLTDPLTRLGRLASRDRDPRSVVVLEDASAPAPAAAPAAAAKVEVLAHADEEVRVRVDTQAAGYLRLADPYDAGWTASIDGAATPVYVADHYLRAVFVPAGTHEVVFRYDGATVRVPQWISAAAALWILVCVLLFKRVAPPQAQAPEPAP